MDRHDLVSHLAAALPQAPPGALLVGFSGGVDSSALLHALSLLPQARGRGLRAVHVDHGVHADSGAWAAHCVAFGTALGVEVQTVRADVADIDDLGLEGAARAARHEAFASALRDDEGLVLAHHRDDQAETVLLRLLHAAGAEGLAGMRALRPFARAWLWRPLLSLGRDVLREHARAHQLQWIEDPSNTSLQHARNHVRHAVLPALEARWPDATRRIAAAGQRLRGESDALQETAAQILAAARGTHRFAPGAGTLDADLLHRFPDAMQRAVLGQWLDAQSLPRPPPGLWSQLATLLAARPDATPCLAWRGAEVRRYRGQLFALRPGPACERDWEMAWDAREPLALPTGFGTLAIEPAQGEPADLVVRPRRGGERIAQPGAHRELRTLLQDLDVPPWIRERLPLLFHRDGTLLAAGDLALAPDFTALLARRGGALRWQPPGD